MKKLLLLLSLFLCVSCSPRQEYDNYPYEPDTPVPAAHDGVFISEYGSFTFNGDGESITVHVGADLSELFELAEGEYKGTYVFLSGNLPPHGSFPIRYDVAHELQLDLDDHGKAYSKVFTLGIAAEDGKSGSVGVDVVTPERIPLLFSEDSYFFDIVFEKE